MTAPAAPRSEFLRQALERGYVHQTTDLEGLDARLCQGSVTAYIGFDATADSLHVGSLTAIMLLRLLQRCGHRPLVLMGGATTRIGDPSGRDTTRLLLTEAQIAANIASLRRVFAAFLEFGDGPRDAVMADNADWLLAARCVDFLRDYGRHFSVNRMLGFDSVRLRLERQQPLSFLEFNYMVFQAYDFLELSRRYGCVLQMGGADQWGNIVSGIDLARRVEGAALYGLTTPLLTTASGAKMGKTAAGAVWLNTERLSPYEYWQYWRNVEDADVGRFLRLFTEVPLDEIARLEALGGAEINDAKKVLADACTALRHGTAAAAVAAETARQTFERGAVGDALPEVALDAAALTAGLGLLALLCTAGLCASNGAARRLVLQGGVRVNGVVVSDPQRVVTRADLDADGGVKLSVGRKNHAVARVRA